MVRFEFIADRFESITAQFELWLVRVEFIADRFESSTLQFDLVTVQVESIALLHIFLNN